jgi:gamma-glutamyltranspeptidase/glutathione hydrolase
VIRRLLLSALLLFVAAPCVADVPRAADGPPQAAIASANAYATDAGMEILAAGGNAFDAAVAVSATLGLVEPESSGLGGGGFMLLHVAKDGRDVFVDAREVAPGAATRDMFLGADGEVVRGSSIDGARAAAIPGLPAGLQHLSAKYGRLPLSRTLAPAIRLARSGWKFGRKNEAMLGWRRDVLAKNPAAAALFLRDGAIPALGTVMRNEDYARTLEAIAAGGADAFYRGPLAKTLVDGVRAGGGLWTLDDLAGYRVVEREPIRFRHRDVEIVTAPPPSSGGITLATILNVLDGWDYAKLPDVDRVHLTAEAARRAYRDRSIYLGDPAFVDIPVALLTSHEYAAGLRAGIHPQKATASASLPGVADAPLRPDTSHFSIIDTEGNLAAVTQTVNLPYGNAVVVAGTGFLLNNEMDDFSAKAGTPNAFGLVGDEANAIAPGKRPASSMTPTFVLGADRVAVLGTPGGSRIPTMVLQGVLQLLDGAGAQQAVDAPRWHHQYLPDTIAYEPAAMPPALAEGLRARGHVLTPNDEPWGNMQAVLWRRDAGTVEAGSDSRWLGVGKAAAGASIHR